MPKSLMREWNLDSPDGVIGWLAERKTLPFWNAGEKVDFMPTTFVKRSAAAHFVEVLELKTKERVELVRTKVRSRFQRSHSNQPPLLFRIRDELCSTVPSNRTEPPRQKTRLDAASPSPLDSYLLTGFAALFRIPIHWSAVRIG